ncbi:hypothetical protein Leryth_007504 [Lithospermum erythrorhizon]|nr:hypothetical protein Leryth_007504 [Lithospermum erythrorhizon]
MHGATAFSFLDHVKGSLLLRLKPTDLHIFWTLVYRHMLLHSVDALAIAIGITAGMWARVKSGKYKADLAQEFFLSFKSIGPFNITFECLGAMPTEDELLKFEPSNNNESMDLEFLSDLYGNANKKKKQIMKNDKGGGKGECSSTSNEGKTERPLVLTC